MSFGGVNISDAFLRLPGFLSDRLARNWFGGFFLHGFLAGSPGPLLVLWRYQIDVDPAQIGLHFLAFHAGTLGGLLCARGALSGISVRASSLAACALALFGLLLLFAVQPPAAAAFRMAGLAVTGAGSGALLAALLYLIKPAYEEAPVLAVNFSGILFGLGSLAANLLVGASSFLFPAPFPTLVLSIVPAVYFVVLLRNRHPNALLTAPGIDPRPHIRVVLAELRHPAAILLSLLLFFQLGSEWIVAGWLPLFLIHQLGCTTLQAVLILALYFMALLVGRLISQWLLQKVRHGRLLITSTTFAMIGYLLLTTATSIQAVSGAAVIIGIGFAPIYPLALERVGRRFGYRPGFYNGVFSIATAGAMFAPAALGLAASEYGMRWTMLSPTLGSIAVLILALLIMLDSRFASDR